MPFVLGSLPLISRLKSGSTLLILWTLKKGMLAADQLIPKSIFALISCGGESSRMGEDKSMLRYHDKPQCYHVYDMLLPFCENVFLSCNTRQEKQFDPSYQVLVDDPLYENSGPISALLTAMKKYPRQHLLLIACDHPFLTEMDIRSFIDLIGDGTQPAAFFNELAALYEPLLGYYPSTSVSLLSQQYEKSDYSLQFFLKQSGAIKFYPSNLACMISVDTTQAFFDARAILASQKRNPYSISTMA
jgi:molybdenum cofactor guanylyltransferase